MAALPRNAQSDSPTDRGDTVHVALDEGDLGWDLVADSRDCFRYKADEIRTKADVIARIAGCRR